MGLYTESILQVTSVVTCSHWAG